MSTSRVKLQPRPPTPLHASLARLNALVSPYTGVVRQLFEILPAVDDARAFYFSTVATASDDLLGGPCNKNNGGGHYNREIAIAAAIGEAVERYSCTYISKQRLILSTAKDLGFLAVCPETFSLFDGWQYTQAKFPFKQFNIDTKVHWVDGFSLPDGEVVFLPAEMVYLGYDASKEGTSIGYSTSSGLACGPTLEEAILSALLEAIERDAFMLTWLNRLSLPVVDLTTDATVAKEIEQQLTPAGLQHSVIDMSIFCGVPTALGIVRNVNSELGVFTVGAASATSMASATRKALLEAYQTRTWARSTQLEQPRRSFQPDFSDIRTFDDHILFYAHAKNARHVAFLDAAEAQVSLESTRPIAGDTAFDRIVEVTRRLKAKGLTAYAVDVTSPDIRQAGMHVVKVVVPEFCQLSAGHLWRFLGGKRLYHAAYELGLRSSPLMKAELNPYPHPFP
ncbi:MAG: YcaO-like family protein [Thermaerobacter sp.]|nr:YcaO-like family protein [Thermaerobacter sp.]